MGTFQPQHDLPDHVSVLSTPRLWLETEAVAQLLQVAARPGCTQAVGLPDLHPGRGVPIGAAFAFEDSIFPQLIGGDAGCGVRLTVARRAKYTGDALLRRVDNAMADDLFAAVDPEALVVAACRFGARGLAFVDGVPDPLRDLAGLEPVHAPADPAWLEDPGLFARQLGTTGGGNHFAEVGHIGAVAEKAAGVSRGMPSVIVHSGSRGVGGVFARRWGDVALDDEDARGAYLSALRSVLHFAEANRFVLRVRLLHAVGATRPNRWALDLDVHHNTVRETTVRGRPVWLHQKGAAPAEQGALTVVLGTRGTPSSILRGTGNDAHLCCVAHGAGRKLGRHDAHNKMRHKYTRKSVRRTATGGHVLYADERMLFEEHPDAYKDIGDVVDALVHHRAATRVAEHLPLITVKQ